MNRRNFFKTVTGFIAGICAVCVPKAKAKEEDFFWIETKTPKDLCGGQNGTLCPRCKFNIDKIPALTAKDWVDAQFNPIKELQLNEPFEGKVVGMCEFQGGLWIATEEGVYRIKKISV